VCVGRALPHHPRTSALARGGYPSNALFSVTSSITCGGSNPHSLSGVAFVAYGSVLLPYAPAGGAAHLCEQTPCLREDYTLVASALRRCTGVVTQV